MRLFLASLIILFASTTSIAMAEENPTELKEDLAVSFTTPVERVNGDPLTIEEISHYDFRCFVVSESPQENIEYYSVDIPKHTEDGSKEFAIKMSELFPDYGDYNCEIATVDTDGLLSDYAFMAGGPVEFDPSKPEAPTNVILLVR